MGQLTANSNACIHYRVINRAPSISDGGCRVGCPKTVGNSLSLGVGQRRAGAIIGWSQASGEQLPLYVERVRHRSCRVPPTGVVVG